MATKPQREGYERLGWPGKGKIMTEDEYHELERLSPDRKYEYIDGMTYMMSGGGEANSKREREQENRPSFQDTHYATLFRMHSR